MTDSRPPALTFRCPKSWDELEGDGARRFCDTCQLHVQDLSQMTRGAAGRFLAAREGRQCIAYRCDERGKMIHAAHPLVRWSGVGALVALGMALVTACKDSRRRRRASADGDGGGRFRAAGSQRVAAQPGLLGRRGGVPSPRLH